MFSRRKSAMIGAIALAAALLISRPSSEHEAAYWVGYIGAIAAMLFLWLTLMVDIAVGQGGRRWVRIVVFCAALLLTIPLYVVLPDIENSDGDGPAMILGGWIIFGVPFVYLFGKLLLDVIIDKFHGSSAGQLTLQYSRPDGTEVTMNVARGDVESIRKALDALKEDRS